MIKELIIGAVLVFLGLMLIALGNIGENGWHIYRNDNGDMDACETGSRTGVFVGLSGALLLAYGVFQAAEALISLGYAYAVLEGVLR